MPRCTLKLHLVMQTLLVMRTHGMLTHVMRTHVMRTLVMRILVVLILVMQILVMQTLVMLTLVMLILVMQTLVMRILVMLTHVMLTHVMRILATLLSQRRHGATVAIFSSPTVASRSRVASMSVQSRLHTLACTASHFVCC